jgi:hypothetical protein
MDLITVVGIERSRDIPIKFTPPDGSNTPLWKLKLWIDEYNPGLPFFSPTEKAYPMIRYEVNSVRIDQTEYLKTNMQRCYQYDESWCYDPTDDSIIYVHFKDHWPPMMYYSRQFGVLYGYTNNGYKTLGNFQQAYELVQTLPTIERSADPLEYGKMKFRNGSVVLDNTDGDFDNVLNVFGYDLPIFVGEKDKDYSTYKRLEQYYISNYEVTAEKATFSGKDKRELISQKAPNTRFARTDPPYRQDLYIPGLVYPFIAESLIDTIVPDAYGYCFRVEGVCLNEDQATTDRWRHFKFSRTINPDTLTSISASPVLSGKTCLDDNFILEVEIGKRWVRLPRNATEYSDMGFQGTYDPNTMWIAIGPVDYNSYNPVTGQTTRVTWTEEGTITIPVIWAHDQEGQTWATDVEGGINAVRLTAKFNPQTNPIDIILDLFEYYGDVEPLPERYDLDEMEYELRKLPHIGIALKEERSLYDIVASFQNGSLLGFQFLGKFDRYTARLDNPNRPTSFHISSIEIINFDKLKIDFGGTNYATWTDIEYAHGYQDDKGLHAINKDFQRSLLEIHRFDKQYGSLSCLADKITADLKALVLMRIFANQLVAIKGIELFGLEYFDLEIYETGFLDLRGIRNRAILTDKDIRVMITNIKKNPATGIVTIDVVRREPVPELPPEYST